MGMVKATATWTPRGDLGRFVEVVATPAAMEAAEAGANKMLSRAQELVHVVSGRLRDSGYVEVEQTAKTVVASVVFDTPYAAIEEFRGPAAGYTTHAYLRPALDESRGETLNEFSLRFKS